MDVHIIDAALKSLIEPSVGPDPDLNAPELDAAVTSESAKEDMAAEVIRKFMAKKIKESPSAEDIPYGDLFEHYVYSIKNKPRRPLADWILDYFYKTDSETYRLPSTPAEERVKAVGRARKA